MAPHAPQDVQLGLPEAAPTGTQVSSRGHCEPPAVRPACPRAMPTASRQRLTQSLEPRGHDTGSQGQERGLDPGSSQGRLQQGQERVDQDRDILGQARWVLDQDGVQQPQRCLQLTVQL